jgi:hypothetical protein
MKNGLAYFRRFQATFRRRTPKERWRKRNLDGKLKKLWTKCVSWKFIIYFIYIYIYIYTYIFY